MLHVAGLKPHVGSEVGLSYDIETVMVQLKLQF